MAKVLTSCLSWGNVLLSTFTLYCSSSTPPLLRLSTIPSWGPLYECSVGSAPESFLWPHRLYPRCARFRVDGTMTPPARSCAARVLFQLWAMQCPSAKEQGRKSLELCSPVCCCCRISFQRLAQKFQGFFFSVHPSCDFLLRHVCRTFTVVIWFWHWLLLDIAHFF